MSLEIWKAFLPSTLPGDAQLPPVQEQQQSSTVVTVHVTGPKNEAHKGVTSLAPNGLARQNFPWENQAGSQHPPSVPQPLWT